MSNKQELPRGGGVQISPNIKKESAFIDAKSGMLVNNFKEKKVVGALQEKIDVTPQEIAEVMRKRA